ncbi:MULTISPECIES: hypothetical protein [Brevibacterium]|uniref:PucR C-terminal helix-turn-helix domain-containing protein n=1 Tax=Brevibacterium casei TaxID=33889 RepID=A0A7T3ZWU0_9MICO|nr:MULTISPECIES: hypothetical protein [Brevibacterium]QQB13122.1 hypothetical protein I6H47_09630 [Brevibacterium casei]
MRDLLGKLTALDPEASETLKVVGYFDALTSRGAGLGSLLRAAAALAGCPAVAEVDGRVTAYDPSGRRLAEAADRPRGSAVAFRSGAVWLVREGTPHANDAMITDRLGVAVEGLTSQHSPTREIEVVVDAERAVAERRTALVRLGIDPGASVRVILSDDDPGPRWTKTAPVPTPLGVLHATLEVRPGGVAPADHAWDGHSRVGIGTWTRADSAPDSWEAALIAHRLLGEGPGTVLDAVDLGSMLILARAYDPTTPHPDVTALESLDAVTTEILRELVDADSLRAAAGRLAMHHSTLQARHESITTRLGYDPRTTVGRLRYMSAEFLRRLGG